MCVCGLSAAIFTSLSKSNVRSIDQDFAIMSKEESRVNVVLSVCVCRFLLLLLLLLLYMLDDDGPNQTNDMVSQKSVSSRK